MTKNAQENTNQKKAIQDFKKKADDANKGLYSDLASFKKGLVLILIAVSLIMLYLFFTN